MCPDLQQSAFAIIANLRASLSARQTKRTEGRKGAAAAEHWGRNDCHAAMFIEMNPRPIF